MSDLQSTFWMRGSLHYLSWKQLSLASSMTTIWLVLAFICGHSLRPNQENTTAYLKETSIFSNNNLAGDLACQADILLVQHHLVTCKDLGLQCGTFNSISGAAETSSLAWFSCPCMGIPAWTSHLCKTCTTTWADLQRCRTWSRAESLVEQDQHLAQLNHQAEGLARPEARWWRWYRWWCWWWDRWSFIDQILTLKQTKYWPYLRPLLDLKLSL